MSGGQLYGFRALENKLVLTEVVVTALGEDTEIRENVWSERCLRPEPREDSLGVRTGELGG